MALGIDISPDLVASSSQRALDAGIGNARFLCANASTVTLDDARLDRLFSRFGSMFIDQPIPAFVNLRTLLKPGARIDLAVWRPPRENLWMMEMMGVVRNHPRAALAQRPKKRSASSCFQWPWAARSGLKVLMCGSRQPTN